MDTPAWTIACAAAAAALGLLYTLTLLAGEASRRDSLRIFRRLLLEKSLRDILPTTRLGWEAAARWADALSRMDAARAADLLRIAADASRRRADRLEAVRKVLDEIERRPAPPGQAPRLAVRPAR
jgi:hypothetical protein